MLKAELVALANALSKTFGYYLVLAGGPANSHKVLAASSIHNHIVINSVLPPIDNALAVACQLDALPFLPESIDTLVLFHALEFVANPTLILKESYDALINGGHLIILGFNPYSLWGLAKLLHHTRNTIWSSKWLTPKKLKRWLTKIGFQVGDYQTFYFRPPAENPETMLFMEGIGQIFWPYCGASYMLIVHKTAPILTPLNKAKTPLTMHPKIAEGLSKPISRVTSCNHNHQL